MTKKRAPVIGITADLSAAPPGTKSKSETTVLLPSRYYRAIELAGGLPVILAPIAINARLRQLVASLDGLLISGGDFDIHPSFYGEKPIEGLGNIKHERTQFELELTQWALTRDLPTLGICGGAQAINVALGGSLYQDIATQKPNAGEHQQGAKKETGGHRVRIRTGTRLDQIVRRRTLEVNTTHHQAVKTLGKGLVVNATAEDGVIEGIESSNHSFVIGLQWHPEVLAFRYRRQQKIFSFFVSACSPLGRNLLKSRH
jgi:putative glutamine amidotransferase